jgi:predicted nucleotidyltransferase
MDPTEIRLPSPHQAVLDRFVGACQEDRRIIAAFLGGSYARDAADKHSDLDLYLITADEDFEDFQEQRKTFIQSLGQPVFLEDFDLPNIVFYVFADGTEGELGFGSESHFEHIHSGDYRVLIDKTGILEGVVFRGHAPDPAGQREKLRRLIFGFWHELSHFITAMGRGQLWWAQGQLEALRNHCVNLARLRHNFADDEAGEEPYFKIEKTMPVEQIAALQATFRPMEKEAMLQSAWVLFRFYREVAPPLAQTHGLTYPGELHQVIVRRLDELIDTQSR